jgi:hypothetical protein
VFTAKAVFRYALSLFSFKDTALTLSKFSRNLLSEKISLKLKNERKRKWVHEFSKQRLNFGAFYLFYRDARFHPDKFKDYLRMSKETPDTQGLFGFRIKHRTDNFLLYLKQNKRRISEAKTNTAS